MNVVAYQFSSPTCNPCNVIKPAMQDLKEEFPQITWVSVNTQNDSNGYCERFGVHVVPTMVVAVSDSTGKIIFSEKHSGTAIAGYYRLLRNGLRYL
jgi:hypothetical protein